LKKGYRDNNSFIERSLVEVISFIKNSVYAEELASKNGLLQCIDARAKSAIIIALVVCLMFTKSIVLLACSYVLVLLLAVLSKIGLPGFLKRTWIFMPLFSLFIAFPALFSYFSPGTTLYSLPLLGTKLLITKQGVFGVTVFILRIITSVSFAILLSLTTRHVDLLRALRAFKIPLVFVMTLGMCYRYIYLFAEMIENTYTAIKSRVGRVMRYKKGQQVVAWNIAHLWYRSYLLNQDVYAAMVSRGYTGEPKALSDAKAGEK